ncbi:MAG: SHOCT domain-containing protein [Chloroflexi bacterium]|nr:SHOCT domain-containing protein [Chloroflexota bacterium]
MGFCCNGFGWGSWMGWGGGWVGLILNLVFFVSLLAALGLGTAWLVRQFNRRPTVPKTGGDPLEIARRRLAAGEITTPEFEEIRDRLQS